MHDSDAHSRKRVQDKRRRRKGCADRHTTLGLHLKQFQRFERLSRPWLEAIECELRWLSRDDVYMQVAVVFLGVFAVPVQLFGVAIGDLVVRSAGLGPIPEAQNPHKTIAAYAKDLDIVVFNGHVHTNSIRSTA